MGSNATTNTKAEFAEAARQTHSAEEFALGITDTFAELGRLRAESAKRQEAKHKAEREVSVLKAENKKLKRDLKAAMTAKGHPIAIVTDESWLFGRNAEIRFKGDPSGRRALVLEQRGERRIIVRGDSVTPGLLEEVLKQGRERAKKRGRP